MKGFNKGKMTGSTKNQENPHCLTLTQTPGGSNKSNFQEFWRSVIAQPIPLLFYQSPFMGS